MARRTRAETVAALEMVPLFSGLTKRQLTAVAREADHAGFEPGAVLVKELDVGQRLIVILAGTAAVTRKGTVPRGSGKGVQQGATRRLGTVGPGDVVGELSLIDAKPTSASVVAETAVEALVLYRTAFIKLFDEMPQLCRRLLVGLAGRVRASDHRADATG